MGKNRRSGLKLAAVVGGLILIFAATWFVLDRSEGRPGWLVVEEPKAAVVGKPLEIRVKLAKHIEATKIACQLHGGGADRRIRSYLASSGPAQEAAGGGTYSFIFEVPEREGIAYAAAIVYLTPTGQWQDRTRTVSTDRIPVVRSGTAVADPGFKKSGVYHYASAAEMAAIRAAERMPPPEPPRWIHVVIGALLLASAALCAGMAWRKKPETLSERTIERKAWLLFAVVLAVSAVLEASGIVRHVASWGRRVAEEVNLYNIRRAYQKAIIASVAVVALGLFFLFIRAIRKPGRHRSLWWAGIGFTAYFALSFVSILSFHTVDVVRTMMWHGVSPVDAVRGSAALMTLLSAALALRRDRGQPTI
jgi:hypothetical protein